MKKLIFLAILLGLTGCTSVTVKPVDQQVKIDHVCIRDFSEDCYDAYMADILSEGFKRHGITTETYTGEMPDHCRYHVTVMCDRTWDIFMHLIHAEITLYEAKQQIGYAEYHLRAKGLFTINKVKSTHSKIDPLIDRLLSGDPD